MNPSAPPPLTGTVIDLVRGDVVEFLLMFNELFVFYRNDDSLPDEPDLGD